MAIIVKIILVQIIVIILRSQAAQDAVSLVMTQEEAEKFAEQFDAIFDGSNVDIADEIFSPDFVGHAPLAPELDRDGWKAYVGRCSVFRPLAKK